MRIMVLGTGGVAADLGLQLAESRGIASISVGTGKPAPALEQELERQDLLGGFVLRDGPATAEQATALDSLLDALDAPLELVIEIDAVQENPAGRSADQDPGAYPLSEYYRERGLLRRIRSEGEAGDILATAARIIDDLVRSRRPEEQDPFATALLTIAREAPPPAPSDATVSAVYEEEAGGKTEPIASSPRPSPGWKRTADRKGRLQRQPAGGKGGRKPRR